MAGEKSFQFMRESCRHACGWCGLVVETTELCVDDLHDCGVWAADGECVSNADYMHASCRRSCGFCGDGMAAAAAAAAAACVDHKKDCMGWAEQGQCEQNKAFMEKECPAACGVCGGCEDSTDECQKWKDDEQ
jgi:hypothetical protein